MAMRTLLIGVFGLGGVYSRYFLGEWLKSFSALPFPIVIINCLGSFLAGIVYATSLSRLSPELRVAISVGFLGGFTTFSAFSAEVLQMLEQGRVPSALAYGLGSPLLGVSFAAFGAWMARS